MQQDGVKNAAISQEEEFSRLCPGALAANELVNLLFYECWQLSCSDQDLKRDQENFCGGNHSGWS